MRRLIVVLLMFLLQNLLLAQQKSKKDANDYVLSLLNFAKNNNETNGLKAISYLQEALVYEGKVHDSIRLKLYRTAGTIYLSHDQYYVALSYFNKYLEQEKDPDAVDKYITYNAIGAVYWRLADRKRAKEFWEKSLLGLKNLKDREKAPALYIAYNNLAAFERSEKNYVKALEMLERYVAFCIQQKDNQGLIKAYQNIAINNMELKDNATALSYFHKSEKIAKNQNLLGDLAYTYFNLSSFFSKTEVNTDSAKYYSLKAYEIGNKNHFPLIEKLSAELLVEVYEAEGDYEKANSFLHIAKNTSESIYANENSKKIKQIEQEHQQKLHEKVEIERSKKRDIIYIVVLLLLVLVIIVFLMGFHIQKLRLK